MAEFSNKISHPSLPNRVGLPQALEGTLHSSACPQSPDGFLELVVDNYRDISKSRRLSPAQHRAARRRVFERIVCSTLSHPQHPFSSFASTPKGKEMISAIIEELVHSHYHH